MTITYIYANSYGYTYKKEYLYLIYLETITDNIMLQPNKINFDCSVYSSICTQSFIKYTIIRFQIKSLYIIHVLPDNIKWSFYY